MNQLRLRALGATLVLLATLLPAGAQTLNVPLSGKRERYIKTETLFHTLFRDFFPQDDATTYVETGDIPAMWLRDASAQTIPYVRFQRAFPILRRRFTGVIERNARAILTDPYANAFQADYHVWERKWEIDSLAWPVLLTQVYLRETGDRTIYTDSLHRAFQTIVATYDCEQHHWTCRHYTYPYRVYTNDAYRWNTGLIWSAFRPSDDPVRYRFNVPQNMMAAIALENIAALADDGYHDGALARRARAIEARIRTGLFLYARYYDTQSRAWMYAYETDGYGNYALMDDPNIPNLTTLPYLNWSSASHPTYLRTRSFALSSRNPWYYAGRYAQGLGSRHTPYRYVWPLGIIGSALTATSSNDVLDAVSTLAETDSENGMIHESFYVDGYWRFTRQEFGWANALYAELLFRSVAGLPGTGFILSSETMIPGEVRSHTPVLVPLVVQIDNAAELNATLRRLLAAGRTAALDP